MFYQQRDLEEKLNKKFEELKNFNKVETSDSNESSKTIESKEDPKIKTLEKEIENLKEKLTQMALGADTKQTHSSNFRLEKPTETYPTIYHRKSLGDSHNSKTLTTMDTMGSQLRKRQKYS